MHQAKYSEISRFLWRAFRSRWRDHRAELSAIHRHIKPGDLVCDVGANKGSFLYWLSRWSKGGRVIAFEPQEDLAFYLSRMCKVLSLDNVTVESKAVFSETGSRTFFVPTEHKPGASLIQAAMNGLQAIRPIDVETITLDDYFAETDRVSVIKIDVEGAELGVFQGAERILIKDAPLLIFECEARHLNEGNISGVFSYLEKLGYRGSFIESGQIKPISLFRDEVHQRQEGDWFWKRSGYCNNFVFKHN